MFAHFKIFIQEAEVYRDMFRLSTKNEKYRILKNLLNVKTDVMLGLYNY